MCSCDYAERPAICESDMVTARKVHQCTECHSPVIQVGQKYERTKGLWDGNWYNFKTCLLCLSLRNLISEECGCYVFGEVIEDAREHDMISLLTDKDYCEWRNERGTA